MRKLSALLLALVLTLGLSTCAMAGASDYSGKLVILHTNDIHGRAVTDLANGTWGYAAVAKLKKDLTEAGAEVLLLDAGDATQGTPLVNLSYGETAFEFMNQAGYDAMVPGNHELDWGIDNLMVIAETAEFPILCANIVNRISGQTMFAPNKIFEMPSGLKVGVFGLDTPEALTKTHPDKVRSIDIYMEQKLYDCAQAQVNQLKDAGCDLVIALAHLGVSDESTLNRSFDVLNNVSGIDLMIDGHSHTVIDGGQTYGDSLLVSTGEYFQHIGMVVYDGEALTASLIDAAVDKDALNMGLLTVNVDEETNEVINQMNDEVQAQLNVAFATTEVDLNGERDPGVRTMETNLGDFAADAMLWSAQQSVGEHVVAAVTNGGGIRASIAAGDITMNDMKTVFPYGNEVSVLTVSGAELLEALEAATCTTPDAIGAFPQVAGIVFTIDTSVPYEQGDLYPDSTYYAPAKPGSRVTIQTVGDQPFNPETMYTIASNDFTAAGGDTYYAFRYANQLTGYKTGVSLEEALVNYVGQVLDGTVTAEMYGEPQGRITVK